MGFLRMTEKKRYSDEDYDKAVSLHELGHFTDVSLEELAQRICDKRNG